MVWPAPSSVRQPTFFFSSRFRFDNVIGSPLGIRLSPGKRSDRPHKTAATSGVILDDHHREGFGAMAEPAVSLTDASAAAALRLATLRALEKKVLWLSAWMIHHANFVRPNRDGMKIGGHQASSASLVTLMTALYFDVLRPTDRVAVKPHASPVFHAIQYLLGPADAREAGALPRAGRGAVLSVAHQGHRRRRLLDRLGRPWRRDDAVRQPRPGLRARKGTGRKRYTSGSHDRTCRRCRTRRRQRARGPARGVEARCPQRLVGDRLQPSEPRQRHQRPPVRQDRGDVPQRRLAGGDAEVRPRVGGDVQATRRRGLAGLDRRLPECPLLRSRLQGRSGVARPADARSRGRCRRREAPYRA